MLSFFFIFKSIKVFNTVYFLDDNYVFGPSQSSFKMSLSGVQDIFMAANHKFYCLVAFADILEQVFWNGWRKKC